ncbi:hypothetical protein PR048_015632 [Dryococelus australis]|uniref:Uncharacterized protein n=1 Tax=Dryococelus australis TaxID=614101 RepID=A0ABQ9HII9_9NEOP|nr:hypothetical protein PR048_015632 [Dryococelus australis]
MGKSSGWTLTAIKRLQLRIDKLNPWALVARYVERKDPQPVNQRCKKFEDKLYFEVIEFPTSISHIKISAKKNSTVSINIYILDDEEIVLPRNAIDGEKNNHFDLLLITN